MFFHAQRSGRTKRFFLAQSLELICTYRHLMAFKHPQKSMIDHPTTPNDNKNLSGNATVGVFRRWLKLAYSIWSFTKKRNRLRLSNIFTCCSTFECSNSNPIVINLKESYHRQCVDF